MSNQFNDNYFEARAEWLAEQGRTEGDVMGLSGGEYIIVDGEEEVEKLLLPDSIQSHD